MPDTLYIGKAGHLAAMSELSYRGYNVAMPEIDKGDDLFVVNDTTGATWRVQVKTSRPRVQAHSHAFQFRVKQTAINTPMNPELHFIFVMRINGVWKFLVMSRAVLHNYTQGNSPIGTPAGDYRQINVTIRNDNTVRCSNVDLTHLLDNWATWPVIG